MHTAISNRVRIGMLALPLYGVLAVASIVLHGPLPDAARDPQGFAQAVSSANFGTAFLITMIGQVVDIFAFLALYGYLAGGRNEGLSFWGMALSIAGGALFLAMTGFLAFAAPAIGQVYLAGQTQVIAVAVAGFSSGPALGVLSVSGLLGTIGAILLAIGIWRSGSLPKWSALLFFLSIPLLAFAPAFSYPLELLGGLLALVSGAWIVLGAWRGSPEAAMGAANPARA